MEIEGLQMSLGATLASARQKERQENDHALVVQFDYQSHAQLGTALGGEAMMRSIMPIETLMESRLRSLLGNLFPAEEPRED